MTELDTINMGYERDDTVISKDEIDKIMFGVVIPSGGIYQTSNKVEVIESCIIKSFCYRTNSRSFFVCRETLSTI